MTNPQWPPPRGPHGQFPATPTNRPRPGGTPFGAPGPVGPSGPASFSGDPFDQGYPGGPPGPTGNPFGPSDPPGGHHDPVPAEVDGPPRRRRWPLFALAGLVAAVVLVGGIDAGVALTQEPTLNHTSVERSVTDLARTGYSLGLLDVACPSDQSVKPGVSFTCSAKTGDGRALTVPITISDTSGRYEVGQPK